MLQGLFHAWERRLANATTDRVVRPFEWGLDWLPDSIPHNGGTPHASAPAETIAHWVSGVMADTDAYYTPPPTAEYTLRPADGEGMRLLTFPSAYETPHAANNTVYVRIFPPKRPQKLKAAVLVLPQWNSDEGGHVGLSKLLALHGMTAARLSLPYHDQRMPPELHRADYIVSANVVRTVQACRQAVLDARRAIAWLHGQGYERIGILGSSLGSCLSLLTSAHEPLIRAAALNHVSPYFADVVWRGISTAHVRAGLDGHIDLDLLRELWKPINPSEYLERLKDKKTLLVYAKYDLTFPVDLSRELVRQFAAKNVPCEVSTLHCGHYTSGKTPFKFIDGFVLARFLRRALFADSSA